MNMMIDRNRIHLKVTLQTHRNGEFLIRSKITIIRYNLTKLRRIAAIWIKRLFYTLFHYCPVKPVI